MNILSNKLEKMIQIDKQEVLIRPITLDDIQREKDFVANLSSESRHFRFLGGVNDLSDKAAKELCDIDFDEKMAFIAVIPDENGVQKAIGVSRYATDNDGDCEFAVAVADEWQNKGLGRILTDTLIEYARAKNKKVIYSYDLLTNTHMRQLADDIGMKQITSDVDSSMVRYELPLTA